MQGSVAALLGELISSDHIRIGLRFVIVIRNGARQPGTIAKACTI